MFNYVERKLSWAYLRSKRKEGFVSVIAFFSVCGIMLGVATLILVTSLMNGIREEMLSNFIGVDGHITIYPQGKVIDNTQSLMQTIKNVAGVNKVAERIEGQVMASNSGKALGAQIIGFHAEDLAAKPKLSEAISAGGMPAFAQNTGIILGERLAQNLGVKVGGAVTLISPQGRATFAGMVPRIKNYNVIGTFKLGMHMLDSSLILMPYADAQTYFGIAPIEGGAASGLEIVLQNMESAPQIAEQINQLTNGQYRVYDWKRGNQSIFTALKIQRDVMVVILALIVIVAAFNIISSLIMLVQDKAADIAILRTMGASRGMILRIFMLAGMGLGAAGTFMGLGLGILAARYIDNIRHGLEVLLGQQILVGDVYFLSSLPTRTDPSEVLAVVALSLSISFFATLYPAWKAASRQPGEALRYE